MRLSITDGRVRAALAMLAALALAPAPARAQEPDTTLVSDTLSGEGAGGTRFEVSAITALQLFDDAAALRSAPAIGLRVTAPRVASFLPGLVAGFSATFSRPTTRGEYFPWNRQIYYSDINRRNDTTLVFEVSQQVTLATYAVELGYRFGGAARRADAGIVPDFRTVSVEVGAGVGHYAIWEDPEQNRGQQLHSMPSALLGAGIGVPLPRNTMLRFRADDVVFLRYDRDWLSLHDPLFAEELFQPDGPRAPKEKSTLHNVRLSVQFSFVPGGAR